MNRTVSQAVEDWFLNSPSWPFDIDIEYELEAFQLEGSPFTDAEVRKAIEEFAQAQERHHA